MEDVSETYMQVKSSEFACNWGGGRVTNQVLKPNLVVAL